MSGYFDDDLLGARKDVALGLVFFLWWAKGHNLRSFLLLSDACQGAPSR